MYGFTFDGRHTSTISGVQYVLDYNVALLPEFENILVAVPKRDGVLDFGRTLKERVIPARFSLVGDNVQDYFSKAFAVADWLNTETVKELKLDAIPNKRIFARLNKGINPERFARLGYVDVDFLCPDPAFEAVTDRTLTAAQNTNINNGGTKAVNPKFTITFTAAKASPFRIDLKGTNKFILVNTSFALNDILILDLQTRKMTKNGIDIRDKIDVTSSIVDFLLPKGNFQLTANTTGVTISLNFRERWI